MTKTLYVLSVIALLAIGFVLGVMGGRVASFGGVSGSVEYSAKTFVGDVYQGMTSILMFRNGLFVGPITSSQAVSLTGSVTLGSTAVTYNPTSFSSSTIASTTVAVTGAVLGDTVLASFDSATSTEQWYGTGRVISAGNVVVNLIAVPGSTAWNAGLDISTSTLRVMVLHK